MRSLFIFAFLVGTIALGLAEENLSVHFDVSTSYTFGTAYEYVFDPAANRYYNDPISRLTWQTNGAAAPELGAEVLWNDLTSTRVSIRSAWTVVPSTLIDEDWNAASTKLGYALIYGRSEHQLLMTSAVSASIEQSLAFGDFRFSLGGLYRWTSWEGWNGTGTYQKSSGTTTYTFTGLLIAYHQQWFIPYLGAETQWQVLDWRLTPSVRVGPYTWCNDMDTHNYAGNPALSFLDFVKGGIYLRAALQAELGRAQGGSWGVRVSAEGDFWGVGDTVETSSQQSLTGSTTSYPASTNGAGTSYYEASIGLYYRN